MPIFIQDITLEKPTNCVLKNKALTINYASFNRWSMSPFFCNGALVKFIAPMKFLVFRDQLPACVAKLIKLIFICGGNNWRIGVANIKTDFVNSFSIWKCWKQIPFIM